MGVLGACLVLVTSGFLNLVVGVGQVFYTRGLGDFLRRKPSENVLLKRSAANCCVDGMNSLGNGSLYIDSRKSRTYSLVCGSYGGHPNQD